MATLELLKKVRCVLQENSRAMNALEVRRALGSTVSKSELNNLLFDNQNIFLKSDEQPPRWTLHSMSASTQPNAASLGGKYVLPGLPTLDLDSGASPMPSPLPSASAGASNAPIQSTPVTLEEKILGVLQNSTDPIPALAIAKQVGLKSARNVNPTLYQLEKERKVFRRKIAGIAAPVWKTAERTTPSEQPVSSSVMQSASATPPQASIGSRELFTKTEDETQVIFTKVNDVNDPSPVVEPVSETHARPQPTAPIQESIAAPVQVSERVHRPIQVAVDDRNRRVAEPVTSLHHSNFAARSKELGEDEIGEAKKRVFLQNIENNESDTEIASPSRVSSTPTLDSVSQSSDLVDSASLSSLSTGTTPPSANATRIPTNATPPSGASPGTHHL